MKASSDWCVFVLESSKKIPWTSPLQVKKLIKHEMKIPFPLTWRACWRSWWWADKAQQLILAASHCFFLKLPKTLSLHLIYLRKGDSLCRCTFLPWCQGSQHFIKPSSQVRFLLTWLSKYSHLTLKVILRIFELEISPDQLVRSEGCLKIEDAWVVSFYL